MGWDGGRERSSMALYILYERLSNYIYARDADLPMD
jgi:hypothetical protein